MTMILYWIKVLSITEVFFIQHKDFSKGKYCTTAWIYYLLPAAALLTAHLGKPDYHNPKDLVDIVSHIFENYVPNEGRNG